MRQVKGLGLASLLLCVVVVCGCADGEVGNPRYDTVQREVNVDGHSLVVIPFRNAGGPFFQSVDGYELTERVIYQMRTHLPKTRFISSLPIRKDHSPDAIEKMTPAQLGEAVDADLVLVGTLKEFSTREPLTTGIMRGTCEIDLKLYDVKTSQETWRRSLTIHYPTRGPGIPSTDTTTDKVREGLLTTSADGIAKKFYTYKQRVGPAPLDW